MGNGRKILSNRIRESGMKRISERKGKLQEGKCEK